MFDDDDPLLWRLRRLCLALPEVEERVSHGRPTWRVAKQFAQYGGGERTADGHVRHEHALLFVPDPGEIGALDHDERFFVPMYAGTAPWRAIDLARPSVDWEEIAELVDASYREVAGKRLLAELDAG